MAAALKRYSALSVTMYTAPDLPTANELPIGSPVRRTRTVGAWRATVPTTPWREANHRRPRQSGSAETIASSEEMTPLRSMSRATANPGAAVSLITRMWRFAVGITARLRASR